MQGKSLRAAKSAPVSRPAAAARRGSLEEENAALRARLASLELVDRQLAAESRRVWELEKTLAASHAETLRFAAERDQLAIACDALERMLLAGEDAGAPAADPAAELPSVLCVGGRVALVAHYRQLARRLGLRLAHHDGGREQALARLPAMIADADAVLCPRDCIGHSAYYQVKHYCHRDGKPCLLFQGAGVAAFAVALARLYAGRIGAPAA